MSGSNTQGPTTVTRTPSGTTTITSSGSGSADGQDGSRLWLRKWQLTVGDKSGKGVDLSELAFKFSVEQSQALTPWAANITVYNVGDNIIDQMAKELSFIRLDGGYQPPSSQYGDVFHGPIAYFRRGRQSPTDTFVEIFAIQFDQPLNHAIVNTWIPAGYTKDKVVNAALAAMTPWGVSLGQITNLGDEKSPRGRVLFGMAADVLRDVAQTAKAQVFIDPDGKLHILKEGEALALAKESMPVLNSQTGMIGIPTQTLGGGVEVRCLLNPAIRPGAKIKLAEKDITRYQAVHVEALPDTAFQQQLSKMAISADGTYNVLAVKHNGENRGTPWYSDITTMPAIPPAPQIRT